MNSIGQTNFRLKPVIERKKFTPKQMPLQRDEVSFSGMNLSKSKALIGIGIIATLLGGDLAMRCGEVREKIARVIPVYTEVEIDNHTADFQAKGVYFKKGSLKGNFNGLDLDFTIDKKILTLLDRRTLSGTFNDGKSVQQVNLNFDQKIDWGSTFKIGGNFGTNDVNLKFENPVVKHGSIDGTYDGQKVDLTINRKLSNLARTERTLSGTFKGKPVELTLRGFFLHGGGIEGTFNGKTVKIRTNAGFSLIRDNINFEGDFKLEPSDKEDFAALVTMLSVNDMFLQELKNASDSSSTSSSSSSSTSSK